MFRKTTGLLTALVVTLALASAATAEEKAKPKAPTKASAGKAVLWSADELKWVDPPNSPPGVKMAVLWGDPDKGPFGAIHKLPAGFTAPLHHHTANHHAVVLMGSVTLTPEGEAAKKLGPGSYFSFTGMKKHSTTCEAGADCQIFVDCAGPWDVVPAGEKKEAPKKEAPKK